MGSYVLKTLIYKELQQGSVDFSLFDSGFELNDRFKAGQKLFVLELATTPKLVE